MRHDRDRGDRAASCGARGTHLLFLQPALPREIPGRAGPLPRPRCGRRRMRPEIRALEQAMAQAGYIADDTIATALFLAADLQKPLLIEGDAGVGKTEVAKVLATLRGTDLIR